jgi:hypothetical protein
MNTDLTIKEELEAPAYETAAFVSTVVHAEHIPQLAVAYDSATGVATT